MSPLRKYSVRVAEWWILVAVLAVAGGILSAVWSVTTATTTWTATAALTSQSQGRSPDQDGVLALGYVDYFNEDSYQQLLRAQANIPDEIDLSAQAAASSPIIYIRASGPSEDLVRAAAADAAEVFRADVRESLVTERRQAADDLQAEIDNNVQLLDSPEGTEVEKNVILDQIRSLQGRLTEFLADNTNQLKQLQPEPGVTGSTPSPLLAIVSGTTGGAVIGILIALVMSLFDRRVRTAYDVQEAVDLPVLAQLRAGQGVDTRTRLRNLLNGLSVPGDGVAPVIAVACVRRSGGAAALAHELASAWSSRRGGSLHVRADLRASGLEYEESDGLVDVLQGRTSVLAAVVTLADGLRVLPPGNVDVDPFAVAEPHLLSRVLEEASRGAGLVVLEAPPVVDAPESQLICAAADRVILLVDAALTRADDLEEAVRLLRAVNAPITGIVLDRTRGSRPTPPTTVPTRPVTRAVAPSDGDVRGNGVGGNAHDGGAPYRRPSPLPREGMVTTTSGEPAESDGSRDGKWQA